MSNLPPIRFPSSSPQPTYQGMAGLNGRLGSISPNVTPGYSILNFNQNQSQQAEMQKARAIEQENRLKELNTKLQHLQKRYYPMVKNVNDQFEDTQKNVKELQNKSQNLIYEQIAKLTKKYEDLSTKFDRFMTSDLDAKVRPLQEDFKSLKNRSDSILISSAQRVSMCGDKIDDIIKDLESIKSKTFMFRTSIDNRINELVPDLLQHERKLRDFQKMIEDSDNFGVSYETLEGMLKTNLDNLKNIDENVIPQQIEDCNASLRTRMTEIQKYNDENLEKIFNSLNSINSENEKSEAASQSTSQYLEDVIEHSFAVENMLSSIESSTQAELEIMAKNFQSDVKETLECLAETAVPDEYTAAVIDEEPYFEDKTEKPKNLEEEEEKEPQRPKKNPYVSVEMLQNAMAKREQAKKEKERLNNPTKVVGLRTLIMQMNTARSNTSTNSQPENSNKKENPKSDPKNKKPDNTNNKNADNKKQDNKNNKEKPENEEDFRGGFTVVKDDGKEHVIDIPLFEKDTEKYDAGMDDLRRAIEIHLLRLRKKIRGRSANNFRNQITAYHYLNMIANTLTGDSNISGHIDSVEAQLDWVISAIRIIDDERVAAQEVGSDPLNLISRIHNCNERCLEMIKMLEEDGTKEEKAQPKSDKKPKGPLILSPLTNPVSRIIEKNEEEEEEEEEDEEEEEEEETNDKKQNENKDNKKPNDNKDNKKPNDNKNDKKPK